MENTVKILGSWTELPKKCGIEIYPVVEGHKSTIDSKIAEYGPYGYTDAYLVTSTRTLHLFRP